MNLLAITLILLVRNPVAVPLHDQAEIIELNHFHDSDGRLVFDQVILWERFDEGYFCCFAWRLCKSPSQIPLRDWARGGYTATWLDGDKFRQVRATSYRETWLQYDPEVEDHQYLPPDHRSGLTGEKVIKKGK